MHHLEFLNKLVGLLMIPKRSSTVYYIRKKFKNKKIRAIKQN